MNTSTILTDNYVIIEQLGSGSFGEVFLARHRSGKMVAAKVESKNDQKRLITEYRIYDYLHKNNYGIGLPKIYDFMNSQDFNIMFMQLLGPSLEDKFHKYSKSFNLPTLFLIADQIIVLLRKLHERKFIHRDIKPNNFLIGNKDNGQIYIMDFGLSKKYVSNDQHIKYKDKRSLIGTARYASINMHLGIEPTRRDDLESVGYMLVYFAKGRLPWQGIKKKRKSKLIELIGESKMCTGLDILCSGLPPCFKRYINYCRNLKFDEIPDYEFCRKLFYDDRKRLNIVPKFCWT